MSFHKNQFWLYIYILIFPNYWFHYKTIIIYFTLLKYNNTIYHLKKNKEINERIPEDVTRSDMSCFWDHCNN